MGLQFNILLRIYKYSDILQICAIVFCMGNPAGVKRDFEALERRRLEAFALLKRGIHQAVGRWQLERWKKKRWPKLKKKLSGRAVP
jgi:hypothetical protein